ncbi:unnamed protein product, partial [marine sediment metagenome]
GQEKSRDEAGKYMQRNVFLEGVKPAVEKPNKNFHGILSVFP